MATYPITIKSGDFSIRVDGDISIRFKVPDELIAQHRGRELQLFEDLTLEFLDRVREEIRTGEASRVPRCLPADR